MCTRICEVISAAAAVVTTDTVYLHAAGAFGRPRVAIFGPTDPALRITDLDRADVLALHRRDLCERAPCHNDMFDRCRAAPVDCMAIPPEQVADAVVRVLGRDCMRRAGARHGGPAPTPRRGPLGQQSTG
ncbi:MAG: hypothetical protein CME06_07575 [Gemmatimonadetes bacterium]|nr:hypothetical protein [Gemmatimonadota bacterium]